MKSIGLILFLSLFSGYFGADDFLRKAAKNVPRIGRSGGADFENFFLKASKSVPRIGRRGDNAFDDTDSQWLKTNNFVTHYAKRLDSLPEDKGIKLSDLVAIIEYNPELLSSPTVMAKLQEYKNSDDFKDYDWETARVKRDKEMQEFRLQPTI